MSYGVRGMEKKLLFSNRYEKDMDLFDDLPDDMPELSDIDDAKVPTLDDFYDYMNKKHRCVPNKERIANKDQFIKTVSELSENYKINADLSEFDAGYIWFFSRLISFQEQTDKPGFRKTRLFCFLL